MDNKKEINPDCTGVTKLDAEGEFVSSLDSDINREVTKEDSSSSIDFFNFLNFPKPETIDFQRQSRGFQKKKKTLRRKYLGGLLQH